MNESCHTYEWVMSHIWMSHVTHINESWHVYERVMSHILSHVNHIDISFYTYVYLTSWESCHTYECVMARIRTSQVIRMNESWYVYERVMSHKLSHVNHVDVSFHTYVYLTSRESCHSYEWVMSHTWISHGKYVESCHSYPGIILHICICMTSRESWHTYEWVMSHICMSHGEYIESCHTHKLVMANMLSHVTHIDISFQTYAHLKSRESWHTYEWVMSHICMSHVTHINESCHTYKWVMSHIWMSHGENIESCQSSWYGVATISRLLKIMCLFCRI